MCHSLKDPNHPALIPHSLWWTRVSMVFPARKTMPCAGLGGRSQRGKPLSCQPQSSVTTEFCAPKETPTAAPTLEQLVSSCPLILVWLGILYPPNSYPHSILTLFSDLLPPSPSTEPSENHQQNLHSLQIWTCLNPVCYHWNLTSPQILFPLEPLKW